MRNTPSRIGVNPLTGRPFEPPPPPAPLTVPDHAPKLRVGPASGLNMAEVLAEQRAVESMVWHLEAQIAALGEPHEGESFERQKWREYLVYRQRLLADRHLELGERFSQLVMQGVDETIAEKTKGQAGRVVTSW